MFLKVLSRVATVLYLRPRKERRHDLVRGIPMNPYRAHPQRSAHSRIIAFCALVAVPFILCFSSHSAQAYIGPGVGAGVVATVLGVVSSIFLLLVGIIYYPIKRTVKMLMGKDNLSKPAGDLGPKRH